jgi:hypothetical protein
MPPRPINVKALNDYDFIPSKIYKPLKGLLLSELLALEVLPNFKPILMQEILGRPRLSNISKLEDIFRLFSLLN